MPKDTERDTRSEILDLARELAQTRSFNWLSYQDLSDRLEIRKASIHYHFPTKADLGAELLRDYRRSLVEWAEKTQKKQASAIDRLDAYFDMFKRILGDGERVCAGGVFSLEWNTLNKEIKDEVRLLYAEHRKFLDGVLRAGRKAGEIRATGTIDEQIAYIGSCLQGALQISRVNGSCTVFNSAVKQLRASLLE